MSFASQIKTDFKQNSFKSAFSLLSYRLLHCFYTSKWCGKIIFFAIKLIFGVFKRLLGINSQISYQAKIQAGIRLPHEGNGVVISKYAIIGENVTIYHDVTIGVNENLPEHEKYVVLENNCYICTGAKIINSRVGESSVVGPNAVVYKDVPSFSRVLSCISYDARESGKLYPPPMFEGPEGDSV